ncbi:MAG: hypothetical protein U0P81_15650 [Holophagaceae bacterium]
MNPWLKRLVGVLTFWPPLYMALFMSFVLWGILGGLRHLPNGPGDGPPAAFILLFLCHLFTILLLFALVAFYAVCVFKHPALPQDRRILWLILILMFGFFAMPAFFWIHLRPLPDDGSLFGNKESA